MLHTTQKLFCEEKKSFYFTSPIETKEINQEYEKNVLKKKPTPIFAQKGLIRGLRGGALLGGVMAMSR